MNPLLMLLFLLWSGVALADPASLPDELAEEAGTLGSILSDGRAVHLRQNFQQPALLYPFSCHPSGE